MFYENGGGICVSAENASIACTAMRKGYIDGTGSSVTSAYVYSEWIEVDWVDGKSVLEFTSDSNHACYLSTNGTGYCWGTPNGSPSSLGSSSNGNNPEEITYVSTSLRDLDVGNRATCVITASSKTLYCGGTTGGGNGELVYHSTSCGNWCPINLQYFETTFSEYASSVQIGSYTGCVIMDSGRLSCWGTWSGHSGSPTSLSNTMYYSTTDSLANLSLGGYGNCLTTTQGNLKCWSKNGVSSNSAIVSSSITSVSVPSGRDALDVSLGHNFACVLLDNNSIVCQGNDEYGQLGDGASTNSYFQLMGVH